MGKYFHKYLCFSFFSLTFLPNIAGTLAQSIPPAPWKKGERKVLGQ